MVAVYLCKLYDKGLMGDWIRYRFPGFWKEMMLRSAFIVGENGHLQSEFINQSIKASFFCIRQIFSCH